VALTTRLPGISNVTQIVSALQHHPTRLAPRSLSAIYYYIIMENTFRFSSLYVFTYFLNSFLFPALYRIHPAICLRPQFPICVAPGHSPVLRVLQLLPCSDRNPSNPQWFFFTITLDKKIHFTGNGSRGDDCGCDESWSSSIRT